MRSKKLSEGILKEVVIPFVDLLAEKFNIEDEKKVHMKLQWDNLLVALLFNLNEAEDIIKKEFEHHLDFGVKKEEFAEYLKKFFALYNVFRKKYIGVDKENEKELIEFEKHILKDIDESDFFFFDSEMEFSEFEEYKKISAKEYLSFNELDEEEVKEFIEIKKELDEIDFSGNYIDELKEILLHLTMLLKKTHEFKELAIAMESFLDNLNDNELIKVMINDIKNWIEHIFILQDAVDIHYLDAAFFANISQIKLIKE